MHETFGQALRRLRGQLSLRDLARLAACGKSYIGDLEHGRRQPTSAMAAALDDALDAGGELCLLAASPPGASLSAQAAALQAGIADALAAGPMTDASLDEWAYTVARHGRATRHRPEQLHLPELLADFADLQRIVAHRHPPAIRKQLVIAVAKMAGLMALTLLKLGDPAARDWWRTGRAAAAAAEDRATLSWIYAQESYQHYYGGDMHGAVELAVRSQHLAGGLPCVGPALSAPLEARAHAALRSPDEAASALCRGEEALHRLDAVDCVASAFGYSESQFRFHAGNTWTHLHESGRAWDEQQQALQLYPATDYTDRTLVQLDRAACLIHDGDPAAAASLAVQAVTALPEDHRSPLIIFRARELIDTVPERQELPEVRVLREVLALPPGERILTTW
ncbi:helix-turn-helix domain-containing protein [Streptomyces sp. H27-D2]|uniref:helix-turn-helix domain-containing protein n=1 Tax=Streptomyces sp. H27-D2 TaxID=3046304 RepID=UPI002DBA6AA7|nr:helix-turn-helix transcriptional regulator [Streptomyces sp. H27-D2]